MKIPKDNQWRQENNSEKGGSLWASFNLNLTELLGNLRITRMLSVANNTDLSGMGLPGAFKFYQNDFYASATGRVIQRLGNDRTGTWTLNTTSGAPTGLDSKYSDLIVFNDTLRVSLGTGSTHYIWNGSTWSSFSWTGALANRRQTFVSFASRLYMSTEDAKIVGIDSPATSYSADATLDLLNSSANTIMFMVATSSRIWIGTLNTEGGQGKVFAWDGESTDPNEVYLLESSGAMAGVVKDDVLYIMDNDGKLMGFNGGTFVEIDRLPIKKGKYLVNAFDEDALRWIHPNGMCLQDNRILILVNIEYHGATASYEERAPSGVWEWSEETGLYHKYSMSPYKAIGGSFIDHGQNILEDVGALAYIKSISNSATDNGQILAGATLFTNASSSVIHVLTDDLNDTVVKYGWLVTPKIYSNNVDETWQKIFVRHKPLLTSTDRIIGKYRTTDVPATDATITWATDVQITSTADLSDYVKGDEVEIIQGSGSGKTAHITSISESGGTYTVNLDDSFLNVIGTSKARFQKWRKLDTQASQLKSFLETSVNQTSTWIQLKICMNWTGKNEVDDILFTNEDHKEAA